MHAVAAHVEQLPIGAVAPGQIPYVWPRVVPLLEKVVRVQTGYTVEATRLELMFGELVLWVVGDFVAILLTAVQQRHSQKVLWVQFLAGEDMPAWLDDWIVVMENYAKAEGCKAIEFAGRPGWMRLHRRYPEYRTTMTTYRREL